VVAKQFLSPGVYMIQQFKNKIKMKNLIVLLISALVVSVPVMAQAHKTLYDFKVKDIDGKDFDLSSLKGKKVLIVNTASQCGNTPQYADLEKLYTEYANKNFVIIGFPANNFGSQEPGTNAEIKTFCTANYQVTFPMMSKISVKGDDMDPLYKWLTQKKLNGVKDSEVTWNFQKYMIDTDGNLVDYVNPKDKPYSDKILNWIKSN
jgi:glutathione peroxidase